jgi:hypothetical protein
MWPDASMTMPQRQRASNEPNASKIKCASDYGSDDDDGLFVLFTLFVNNTHASINFD